MSIKLSGQNLSRQEFSRLSIADQVKALRPLDARQKAALLLETENAAKILAKFPVQEVYLMAMERGPENLPELLGMATPEQWTGFVDLDCWDGDEYVPAKVHRWLATLLENDEETIFQVLRQMDFEQLTLILRAEIEIVSGPESMKDDDTRIEAVKRDGGYEIRYESELQAKLYGRLLEIIQQKEAEFFVYLLEAVRAESFLFLQENVYQQRVGRMLDMGIPEAFEARKVYSWLDPEAYKKERSFKIAPGAIQGLAPSFSLTLVRPKGLLAAVIDKGVSDETAWEITNVVNKVMMADRIDMGNLEEVSAVIDKVDANLNLALGWLCGDDEDAAAARMLDCYCEDLFRVGFSLILRLHRRASQLNQSSVAPYLDENAMMCLDALTQYPPVFFEGVSNPVQGGTRLFSTLSEVRAVEAWLDRMELQQQLFEEKLGFILPPPEALELDGCQPEEASDLTLADFFLTALANKLLGRDFQPLPIAEEELAGLHGMVSQSGVMNSRLREETGKWLDSLLPGGRTFADYCLDVLEEEFCSIGFADIDPRFIGGLIVKLEEV